MDDFLSGEATKAEAIKLRDRLLEIMATAKMVFERLKRSQCYYPHRKGIKKCTLNKRVFNYE